MKKSKIFLKFFFPDLYGLGNPLNFRKTLSNSEIMNDYSFYYNMDFHPLIHTLRQTLPPDISDRCEQFLRLITSFKMVKPSGRRLSSPTDSIFPCHRLRCLPYLCSACIRSGSTRQAGNIRKLPRLSISTPSKKIKDDFGFAFYQGK